MIVFVYRADVISGGPLLHCVVVTDGTDPLPVDRCTSELLWTVYHPSRLCRPLFGGHVVVSIDGRRSTTSPRYLGAPAYELARKSYAVNSATPRVLRTRGDGIGRHAMGSTGRERGVRPEQKKRGGTALRLRDRAGWTAELAQRHQSSCARCRQSHGHPGIWDQ